MIIFPAIDLKGGQVVRLAEGDMARATVYGDNPAAQATLFAQAGASWLHVVDLDGSFAGRAENARAVEGILKAFPGHVQLGGGIRTAAAVEGWFGLGVRRVVMGTAALKDPAFVKDMAKAYPGGIVVAVDARDGMVATEGWAEVSDVPVAEMAARFEDAGVAALLFTDIGRDGLLKGCNVEATVELARVTRLPVIASGGVASIRDIELLAPHAADGIEGVITGRALYDGRLDLAEAIALAGRRSSIDKIIATIARSDGKQRKTMREHALATLQKGDKKLMGDADKLLKELNYFEAKEGLARTENFTRTITGLVSASLTERVVTAFQSDPPTDTENRLIQVLLDNPHSTCTELSTHIGWHPDAWDMGFGSVCSQRRAYFKATTNVLRGDKSPNIPLLAFQERDENGKIRYTMKPEAVEAFKRLGFRVKSA